MSGKLAISPTWQKAIDEITGTAKLCMVIGPVDSGKSSFCLAAVNAALKAGRRPAMLDLDPGQSDIGPPACLGLGLIKKQIADFDQVKPDGLFFIGSTTPVGYLREVSTGSKHLVNKADELGADLLIVNTTGLISGPGRALKAAKIRLLKPSHIVAIDAEGETEEVLSAIKQNKPLEILRLLPSSKVKVRDAEERRKRRERQFTEYFKGARKKVLAMDEITFPGEAISGREKGWLENLSLGLYDSEDECIGLGILQAIDFDARRLRVLVPRSSKREISGLRFGSLRLTRDGQELEKLPPGFWE